MKGALKALLYTAAAPLAWLADFFSYGSHLENYRHFDHYEPYDFSHDYLPRLREWRDR